LFYFDSQQTFLLAEYGREEILDRTTIAEEAIVRALFKLQPALVQVLGDLAPPHAELDPARLAKTVPRLAVELNQKLLRERGMAWNVIAAPTETWAERLFGERDERLERLVARAMRLDCADPVAAWRERLAALLERRQLVDGCGFDALQFRGPGTDLAVPLAPNAEWESTSGETAWGQTFTANLPTEEVWTAPDARRTHGHVRATRPFLLNGSVIDQVTLEFRDGRVVKATAAAGEPVLHEFLRGEPGSDRLGEVALVADSVVGDCDFIFEHTLFDENVASHIALGMAYRTSVPGSDTWSDEECRDHAVNVCTLHVDLPIGGPDVYVDGIRSRERVPIIRDGGWVLR
jgi:aminopeptidase